MVSPWKEIEVSSDGEGGNDWLVAELPSPGEEDSGMNGTICRLSVLVGMGVEGGDVVKEEVVRDVVEVLWNVGDEVF